MHDLRDDWRNEEAAEEMEGEEEDKPVSEEEVGIGGPEGRVY
jgi:hypothetical protein